MITTGQGKQILVFSLEILQLIMMSSDFADNQSHYIEVMQGANFMKKIEKKLCQLKFIFWEGHKILQNLHLTFVYSTKVKISQNFVAFSEYEL